MNNTIPKVDLNFRHYIGERSDVVKYVQAQLKNYLRNPNVDKSTRIIYSAIYNALIYYQAISDVSISGESAQKTYLENTVQQINDDYHYLAKKYNKDGLEVIKLKCRVKSPVSAMDKILSKVQEYVKTGRDLSRLNESLRDFVGIRFIVTAPPEIKALGKKAESDFCYQVFNDLVEYHGISRQLNNEEPQEKDFHFIPVDTDHDPNKLQKIKDRALRKDFFVDPDEEDVYIPSSRPAYIEPYDRFVKDYRMYPKPMLYQRMHICANPYYSNLVPNLNVPNYIIPPKSRKYAVEYQICTDDEEWWAEFGKAAHIKYKNRSFHRLGIPLLITFDKNLDKVRLNRLDECMHDFYGYSFEDRFGIDYQEFLNTFDTEQRNEILAGIKKIIYDEKHEEYALEDTEKCIILESEKNVDFVKNLITSCTKEELQNFFLANGISYNTIYVNNLKSGKKSTPKLKLYSFSQPAKIMLNYIKKSHSQSPAFEDGPEQ